MDGDGWLASERLSEDDEAIKSLSGSELDAEVRNEAEKLFRTSGIKFLCETVPEYKLSSTYGVPKPASSLEGLYAGLLTFSSQPVQLSASRNPETGEVVTFEMASDYVEAAGKSSTSLSLKRLPNADPSSYLMGCTSNLPFMPGGLEEHLQSVMEELKESTERDEEKFLRIDDESQPDLLTRSAKLSGGLTASKIIEVRSDLPKSAASVDGETARIRSIDLNTADIFQLIEFVSGGFAAEPAAVPSREATPEGPTGDAQPESSRQRTLDGNVSETAFKEFDEHEKKVSEAVGSTPAIVAVAKGSAKCSAAPLDDFPYAQVFDASFAANEYEKVKPNMARKYPFELDPFQQQAVVCMERGDSIFVAAHTSAGKTVVAEYAVALCSEHKTRAIYTSPIKALSNQKFREFKMIFEDVGLITGDIQLHPEAFALIMTTEVLRSMLYNGSEVIRELEWVIFDEVHYINDAERGHVWEEVLIMLPSHVKIAMLSATVPNCIEFADWVGRIKNRQIYVVATSRRPVPLEHYLYTGQDGKTKKDLFKIVDSSGDFLSRGYGLACAAKANLKKATTGPKGYRPNNRSDKNIYINLISHLTSQNLLPMVVFVFSRRRCDENAGLLTSVDLTTAKEKSEVHHFFTKCIGRLKGSDKMLPQVLQMAELCKRGFAVHHSGILPILKEIVELLFQKGYIKILFATETFAMGVNMPARTVVFDSFQKHDGKELRTLKSAEYIQMAGRAGRRGLDSTGTVILLCKGPEVPEPTELNQMMLGKPAKLESRFRVTYFMLLNLLRVEHLRIEEMLQRSFVECSSLRKALVRKERVRQIRAEIASLPKMECAVCCVEGEGRRSLSDYHSCVRAFVRSRMELWPTLFGCACVTRMLTPGRLLIVCLPHIKRTACLAALVKVNVEARRKSLDLLISVESDAAAEETEKQLAASFYKQTEMEQNWLVESAFVESVAFVGLERVANLRRPIGQSVYRIVEAVPITWIVAICQKSLKVDFQALLNDAAARTQPKYRSASPDRSIARTIIELDQQTSKWALSEEGASVALPGRDLRPADVDILSKITELNDLRNELVSSARFPCVHCTSFREHLSAVRNLVRLEEEREAILFSMSARGLLLSQEYADRIKVLRVLHYVDQNNMVTLKGKVACEVHHQELIITELLLDNKLHSRTIPEIAAMLSSLTCQHKSHGGAEAESEKAPPAVLITLKEEVLDAAAKISQVQRDCGVREADISEELNFDLMHVVYEWARATPFAEIMGLTDAQEGLIVRCIQRLDELCRDVGNAARLVGDPALCEKMESTSNAIKRDIVFAASLYTVVE